MAIVMKHKTPAELIADMHGLKTGADLEADMTEPPSTRNVKTKRPVADKMSEAASSGLTNSAPTLTGESDKVSARIDKAYTRIAKERGLKISDMINTALQELCRQNGWL